MKNTAYIKRTERLKEDIKEKIRRKEKIIKDNKKILLMNPKRKGTYIEEIYFINSAIVELNWVLDELEKEKAEDEK